MCEGFIYIITIIVGGTPGDFKVFVPACPATDLSERAPGQEPRPAIDLMGETNFYGVLEPFRAFDELGRDQHFRAVPADWDLFVTDVKDSTGAIEAGNYRDVNKLGAASITVVREALDGVEFPFAFGGDGALLVVPPGAREDAKRQLIGLRRLAGERFDLDLRVGSMPVEEVLRENVSLEVAKLELTDGQHIALFRGGGGAKAEDLVKERRSRYAVEGSFEENMDMTGLSCRWKPIPSVHGQVLSILVESRSAPHGPTYERFLDELDEILEGGFRKANPINLPSMSYRSVAACLEDELRYHRSPYSLSFLFRVCEILLAVAIFRYGLHPVILDPDEYRRQLRTHSDYRKFDDMLRFTIDCCTDEKERIESCLRKRYEAGELFFGIREADESLMTCYVEDTGQGGHLHFIDGGGGGYASAASQLKAQKKEVAGASEREENEPVKDP